MSIVRTSRRRNGLGILSVILGILGAVPLSAGQPRDSGEKSETAILERYSALAEFSDELDWEAEFEFMSRAIDNVWEQNGWNDEANQFARTLARDVAAIPPWDLMGRFDLMSERVAERYQFSPNQSARYRQSVLRETSGLLMRHAGLVFDQTVEILRTRAAKRPFTPEQAARWTVESEEFFRDARNTADRIVKEMTPSLRAEQKEIMDRDMSAFDKRWQAIGEMRARWARGEWRPDDWGLQDDPIQGKAVNARGRQAGSAIKRADRAHLRGRSADRTRWVAHDPSTWMAYVKDFQRRYGLDPGQASAARSIHDELVERATGYAKSRTEQLRAVPVAERAAHELYEPIRGYFFELQIRLEVIPTAAQRDSVQP